MLTRRPPLLDVGGARLERFGGRIVDRPAAGALETRHDPDAWASADLRFDRDRGWTGPGAGEGPWSIEIGGLTLELRPTDAGQVGLFPEHAAMLPWLRGTTGHDRSSTCSPTPGWRRSRWPRPERP